MWLKEARYHLLLDSIHSFEQSINISGKPMLDESTNFKNVIAETWTQCLQYSHHFTILYFHYSNEGC